MKTYKINTEHTIYIDSHTEGEGQYVNGYSLNAIIKAETPRKAIEKYFYNTLYLPFKFEDAYMDDENTKVLHYSNLVDEESQEPAKHQIEEWKKGELTLYANNIVLTMQELTDINII